MNAIVPSSADRHGSLLARLSRQSVVKHFDAYADIDWEHPDHRIDLDDPRWEKDVDDPLGATEWYRSQPQPVRARIGLHHVVCQMKIGVAFEAILSRGLLEFASALPNGSPEFRYAYHELIEEGQHSLMFQELVNRSGLEARGLSRLDAFGARFVPRLGVTFPELFFLFVLGGEAPIDHVQRRALEKRELHPLLRLIMRIHVTEEARHLAFAKSLLAERVPRLGRMRRFQLQVRTPLVLAASARSMLVPPAELVETYAIPRAVLRRAYRDYPRHRAGVIESIESVRALCRRIGLLTPRSLPLWKALGVAGSEPSVLALPAAA